MTGTSIWDDIWRAGLDAEGCQTLTAVEAAQRRGSTTSAAYKWAKTRQRKWRITRRGGGKSAGRASRQFGIARREQPSNGTTWAEQHALGRCLTDAAKAMGKSRETGRRWARFHGVVWSNGHGMPEINQRISVGIKAAIAARPDWHKRNAEHLRSLDRRRLDGFATRRNDPARSAFANLTSKEQEDYRLLRRKKYSADEAFVALGRPELTSARFRPAPAADPVIVLRDRMAASAAETARRLAEMQAAHAPACCDRRRA